MSAGGPHAVAGDALHVALDGGSLLALTLLRGLLVKLAPAQLSDAEVEGLVRAAIASTGAASMKDMGKVMAAVKPQVQGRTDMGALSARIKSLLST